MDDSRIDNLYERLNFELLKVEKWISANCLSLNVSKTVYLLFSGRKKIAGIPSLYLFNEPIQRNTVTKFLGMMIDDKLNWKEHINYLYGKISRMVGIIYRTRDFLTLGALKTIYYSLVYPHLLYGIIFWSGASKFNFNKIFKVQKKIVRLITGSPFRAHTNPLFSRLAMLKLEDIKKLEMCKFIYNNLDEENFFNFSTRSSVHSHDTRNRSQLNLPQPRSNLLLNSIFFEGIRVFNDLNSDVKMSCDVQSFKYKMKRDFLNSYSI